MPDWALQLTLAIIGSSPILGGIGWWVKTRRDDRLARELADKEQIKQLQQEVKDLLQDRIKYEMVRRESSDQTNKLLTEAMALLRETLKKPTGVPS